MGKLILRKNLRRSLMQGHPWLYDSALIVEDDISGEPQLLPVYEKKQHLGWAIYNPSSELCARILSLEKSKPTMDFVHKRIFEAAHIRKFDEATDAYRMINGEGDLLPGLVIDLYASTAILQTDGDDLFNFWEQFNIAEFLVEENIASSVFYKSRSERTLQHLAGDNKLNPIEIKEHGAKFIVDTEKGQKTGFFLDQRENRLYLRQRKFSGNVCNLFSYTGGFSINAGLGGAQAVTSVDISKSAIKNCQLNWELNGLEKTTHRGVAEDVFDFLNHSTEQYDVMIVDPPSMAPSQKSKQAAIKKYTDCFARAAQQTKSHGDLLVSSCSSHIHFSDFFAIISASLSQARRRGQILRVSGQGEDHPYPHALPEMRYLKFVHIKLS